MAGYQPRHDTDPVWFNGTQVNSLTYVSAQVGVRVTAIYGWDDRPDVRDVREDRAGDDGEFVDELFLGGRTITVEGEVAGSSWVNLQARKRSLAALFAPSASEVLFKVPDPATVSPTTSYSTSGMTGYERVSCRVIEAIQFGDSLDPMCQTWQVVLRASDPRVYSDVVTSTDSGTSGTGARTVVVDQGGSYPTPVELTVTGPTGSDLSITEPTSGLSIATTGLALDASETLMGVTRERTLTYTATYERIRLANESLIALWMLDESAGTTADNEEGTAAYDGTYTGGYTLNQAGPATGIASVDLNGSTGYIAIPSMSVPSGNSWTLEGWFNVDAVSGTQTIWDRLTTGPDDGIRIYVTSTGQLGLDVAAAGGIGLSSHGLISASTWYHVCVVMVNSFISIYVNGVQVIYGGVGGYGDLPSATSRIGATRTGTNFLNGRVAAFALYDSSQNAVELYESMSDTAELNAYPYVNATISRWANLGTASSTYTLSSSGLNTGSKLNVSYRDA